MHKIRFLVFLSCCIFSHLSWSCSCVRKPLTEDDLKDAKSVFLGKVIETIKDNKYPEDRIIKFLVEKPLYKAELNDTVVVHTSMDIGFCGINVYKDQKWYVFISQEIQDTYSEKKYYWISQCGRSINLTKPSIKRKDYGKGYSEYKYYKMKEYHSNRLLFKDEKKQLKIISERIGMKLE